MNWSNHVRWVVRQAFIVLFVAGLLGSFSSQAEAQNGSVQAASYQISLNDGWNGWGPGAGDAVSGTVTCQNGSVSYAQVTIHGYGNLGSRTSFVVTFDGEVRFVWRRWTDGFTFSASALRVSRNGNRVSYEGTLTSAQVGHHGGGYFSGVLDLTCPPPPPPSQAAIEPIVECISADSTGLYTAYLGYNNSNSYAVLVPAGTTSTSTNALSPAPYERGQPTTFLPGRQVGILRLTFDGSPTTWTIKPSASAPERTVQFSRNTRGCVPVQPVLECIDDRSGALLARYGYRNDNPFPVYVRKGADNTFMTEPFERGQPELFASGRIVNNFSTPFAPGVAWRLQGVTAVALNQTPLCAPTQPPVCSIVQTGSGTCQGSQTTIRLDGGASKDPEGLPVTYAWSTSCPNSTLTRPNGAVTDITLRQPGLGQPAECLVTLAVSDGYLTSSCSSPIQVNACQYDCRGVNGGSAKVDLCGVCGGSNACIDCNGVANGGARPDVCGVCGGDGSSCQGCIIGKPDLGTIDVLANEMKTAVQQLIRRVELTRPKGGAGTVSKKFTTAARRDLAKQFEVAWSDVWRFPSVVQSCAGSQCAAVSLAATRASIVGDFNDMLTLNTKVGMQLTSQRPGRRLTASDRRAIAATRRVHDRAIDKTKALPDTKSVCS